ncbi:MAG: SDR family NAD(P)-dependent oxidoreductase [Candidatus Omnitrophota bacterium]
MGTSPSLVIIITGCSSGFGLLASARLSAAGHRVHACVRDLKKCEALHAETASRGGSSKLSIHVMNVADPVSIKAAVAEVISCEGVIDVLINNAGFGIGGFFEDLSDEDWRQQFDTNFFGVLNVTREVLPFMRRHRSGRIINISSLSAFSGMPAFSAYVSSKWALEGFSESLNMELKPFGIDVLLVEPGSYRTKIFSDNARYAKNFNNQNSPYYAMSVGLQSFVNKYLRRSHRSPEEVAIVLEALATKKHVRFRNIIGVVSRLRYWVVRHIPFEFYAWIVNRILSWGNQRHA